MKRILNAASDTVLLVSLLTLFAIPVIVFGGFTPTTVSTKLSAVPKDGPNVLGASTITPVGEAGEEYLIELVPSFTDGMQIEELSKTAKIYEFQTFIPTSNDDVRDESLLRIVNTSTNSQRVVLSLSDYSEAEHLKYVELKIDNTTLKLEPLIKEPPLEPSVTLQPGEWLSIGFKVSENLPKPTTLTLTVEFLTE